MKDYEKIQTIRNVMSDLQAILEDMDAGSLTLIEGWQDAKIAAEYIVHDIPHG